MISSRHTPTIVRTLLFAVAAASPLLTTLELQAGPWNHLTENDGLPSKEIQCIERDGNDVWVGTLKGLALFRDGKPTIPIRGEAVWDIQPIKGDRYWVGTENGVVLLSGTNIDRSLKGLSIGRIVPFGTNGYWAITKQGDQSKIMELVGKEWRPVRRFEKERPINLFRSSDGILWVLLDANGVVAVNPAEAPEKWVHHQQRVNITAFYEDPQHRIWCGTWARGIMVLEKGVWRRMLEQEDAAITGIRQDSKGHIWVATNSHGVWQYDGANWINHLNEEGMINMLDATSDGRVFVSSQTVCGLRQWNGKAWEIVVDAPTMFLCVTDGPKGKIWAGNILDGIYVQP